jgi:3-mercaptopyruvate sulfurtransferase SseA
MEAMQQNRLSLSLTITILLFTLVACTSAAPTQPAAPAFPTENPHLDIERVSLEDAKAAFDSGTAIFVDVRRPEAYAASHIPGALSMPAIELADRLDELDPDQWIITYCT